MKVYELIQELKKYPKDKEVNIWTWASGDENLYVAGVHGVDENADTVYVKGECFGGRL